MIKVKWEVDIYIYNFYVIVVTFQMTRHVKKFTNLVMDETRAKY